MSRRQSIQSSRIVGDLPGPHPETAGEEDDEFRFELKVVVVQAVRVFDEEVELGCTQREDDSPLVATTWSSSPIAELGALNYEEDRSTHREFPNNIYVFTFPKS